MTLAIRIDLPPTGELETNGWNPEATQEQMDEELAARQKFIDGISPYLESLPTRPLRRAGNVSHVKLLGRSEWSELNHYLLLVEVDIWIGKADPDLAAALPPGAEMSVIGDYAPIQEWSKPLPS